MYDNHIDDSSDAQAPEWRFKTPSYRRAELEYIDESDPSRFSYIVTSPQNATRPSEDDPDDYDTCIIGMGYGQ